MTCIVGLETPLGVIMGGDSGSASGWDGYETRLKKVFWRGAFLIGYTTSFRMGQILQYRLEVKERERGASRLEYLSTVFVDAVRQCLKDGGYAKKEYEVEEGGQFLVGYKERLFEIGNDFQVNSCGIGFMSVGCGFAYALGSLFSSGSNEDPEARIIQALSAAATFSVPASAPFHVLSEWERHE